MRTSKCGSSRRLFLTQVGAVAAIGPAACGANPSWPDERRKGRFVWHADFSLQSMLEMVDDFTRLEQELTKQLGIAPSQQPIHLFLFQSASTYKAYLKRHFPQVPYRRALFVKGRGPGMVFAHRGADFETDLRHECTHAILHAALPYVPIWLDEGIAEYFELAPKSRAKGHPARQVLKRQAQYRSLPPLNRLEGLQKLDELGLQEYYLAWGWVHFMLHGPPEALAELRVYFQQLQRDQVSDSLGGRLTQRFPDLARRFREHLQSL